jgi:hypothetical protein
VEKLNEFFLAWKRFENLLFAAICQFCEFASALRLENPAQIPQVDVVAAPFVALHLQEVVVHHQHPCAQTRASFSGFQKGLGRVGADQLHVFDGIICFSIILITGKCAVKQYILYRLNWNIAVLSHFLNVLQHLKTLKNVLLKPLRWSVCWLLRWVEPTFSIKYSLIPRHKALPLVRCRRRRMTV